MGCILGLIPGPAQADRRGSVQVSYKPDQVGTPSERQQTAHFYTLLPECIRAPCCGVAARIADDSPLQAACIVPLRPKGTSLAPLCGLSPLTLLHRFLPAGHAKHGATPSGVFNRVQSGQSGAWGNPNKRMGVSKTIFPCPACLRNEDQPLQDFT